MDIYVQERPDDDYAALLQSGRVPDIVQFARTCANRSLLERLLDAEAAGAARPLILDAFRKRLVAFEGGQS